MTPPITPWRARIEPFTRPLFFAVSRVTRGMTLGVRGVATDGDGRLLLVRVLKPDPRFFSYSLSKSALWFATRTMAQALAPRIRVNGVGPGPTLPSIHQSDAEFAAEAAAVPLERPGSPQAVAAAVRWLVGADLVTGQMIAVDGGQHLAWRTPDIADPDGLEQPV